MAKKQEYSTPVVDTPPISCNHRGSATNSNVSYSLNTLIPSHPPPHFLPQKCTFAATTIPLFVTPRSTRFERSTAGGKPSRTLAYINLSTESSSSAALSRSAVGSESAAAVVLVLVWAGVWPCRETEEERDDSRARYSAHVQVGV